MTDPITTPEQMREAAVLLPCPFCGGQAGILIETGVDFADCTVTCHDCSAETFARAPSQDGTHSAHDAAIAGWNRRAIPCAPQPIWPDFIAPRKYDNPDPRWIDPALPDFRLIWKVARECGYAVGLHGSMKRDCDLIAVPWTDEAVLAFDLIACLCKALNAQVLGPVAGKPHGRLGWNLQVDGYVKVIDISVFPRSVDQAVEATPARDVRAAALREAAAAIHPEIPRGEWTAQDEAEAELAGIILALIDKETQP